MRKLFWIGMILLAVALVALAADNITGKWTFEMPAGRGFGGPGGGGPPGGGPPDGGGPPGGGGPGAGGPGGGGAPGGGAPRIATLELKADGAKLTGTLTQPAMGRGGDAPAPTATPIANGKVDGNNVSFDVTRESQMGSMTTKYKGVVSGSEMKLTSTMDSPMGGDPIVRDMTAKKQ